MEVEHSPNPQVSRGVLHDGKMDSMSSVHDKNSIPNTLPLDEIPISDELLEVKQRGRRKSLRISDNNQVETFGDLKLYGNNVEVQPHRQIPPASDLDIDQVCKLLYLNRQRQT
ncbi:unnamed protein product [Allacma fusca]|uniref:Uncharacterized protein n=1 Tax=Allacma fusca TaxID=39272 RepID=A0A8J2PSC8_9HEXA|nr:unnamed protein product [Allacma fusca]